MKPRSQNLSKHGVLDNLKLRFKRRQNLIICVTGPTGSGKSYSGLRLACAFDRTFDESRIVFSAQEFLHLLNYAKLKKGQFILWDEAGVNLNTRDWSTKGNKAVNAVIQTFRHRRLGLVLTLPSFNWLDRVPRSLVHVLLETKQILYSRHQVRLRMRMIENNDDYSKPFKKYPRLRDAKGEHAVSTICVGRPYQRIVDAYERKKNAFTKQLNLDMEARLNIEAVPVKKPKPNPGEIAEKILAEPDKYIRTQASGRKFVPEYLVARDFDVGNQISRRVQAMIAAQLNETRRS